MSYYWTFILSVKSLIWFGLALACHIHNPNQPMITMAYVLSGMVFILIGLLADKHVQLSAPKLEEVLLRHDHKAYVLNIFRTAKGEVYAPNQDSLRVLREVNTQEVPKTMLGCPHFTPRKHGYEVLGQLYST